jgi:hypothetical protein
MKMGTKLRLMGGGMGGYVASILFLETEWGVLMIKAAQVILKDL